MEYILGDLGSCVEMKGVNGVTYTITNFAGTEPFCSPEVIKRTWRDCNKRLDNWSLGVTLYMAFELKWPFGDLKEIRKDFEKTLNAICHFEIEQPTNMT